MVSPFLHYGRSFPVKLIVDIHSYCNARCTVCPYPRYSRHQSQGCMEWGLYSAIVDELAQIGKREHFRPQLGYCYMGEPFLADDLAAYVRYALERDIEVYLNTNASAMTPEGVDALLASGFAGKIHISFHGISPEVYRRITGLDYDTSLSHILYLLERYEGERVCIRGVDDNWPRGERRRWVNFWASYGVELEYVRPVSRCGGVQRLLPRRLGAKDVVKLYGCRFNHPLVEMVILFDGRAVMCCQDMGRELIWGDVGKDGILGVWNGMVRAEVIRRLYTGLPSDRNFLCARCEQALGPGGMMHSVVQTAWRKFKKKMHNHKAAAL